MHDSFASAEQALEAAGLEKRGEALEHERFGRWCVGHFAEFRGGGAEVFGAEDIGD